MKKIKKFNKAIVLSALSALAFGGIAAGTTYALFTSESTTSVSVTTGKVAVDAEVDSETFKTYSGVDLTGDENATITETEKGTFTNGGTATLDDKNQTLTLVNMTPGDKVSFTIKVKNKSSVKVKYRTRVNYVDDYGLSDALVVTINDQTFNRKLVTEYKDLTVGQNGDDVSVTVEMPSSKGSEYQNLSCKLKYVVEAVQGNAATGNDATASVVYPKGISDNDFCDDNTIAYVEGDTVKYTSNFSNLITNSTVSEIYCKAGSTITTTSHMAFNRDLTIYGNGASFEGGEHDLSTNSITGTVNLSLYDTNNLAVWGSAISTGAILNLYEEGCTSIGTSRVAKGGYLLYTKSYEDKTTNQGTLNATFKYCKVTKAQLGYSTSSKGNTTFENCVFRECGTGVKTKLKTTANGEREDTIKNCLFIDCGVSSEDTTDVKVPKYTAPISYSNDDEKKSDTTTNKKTVDQFNGTLTLNVSGCRFYQSRGENGDILLGDNRDDEQFDKMTLNLTTDENVSVRTAHDKLASYSSGTITCPAYDYVTKA